MQPDRRDARPESTFASADRTHLAVHRLGGDGPPLVFAHAAGFHGRVWGPLADRLTTAFRCIAPDLRGHGDSGVADDDLDWRGFAADLLATVDRLGLERPFAVGHSSGATALLLAEQSRPGTFRALYCFEPVLVPADPPLGRDPDSWLAERARRRRASFASRDKALAHYAARPPLCHLEPEVLRAYVEHGVEDAPDGSVRLKCRPEIEGRTYEMATAHDAYGKLGDVRCPVTLARGAESDATGDRQFAHLSERLPHVRTECHPGLGHLGPLERPATVADSVRRIFAEALRPGRTAGPH